MPLASILYCLGPTKGVVRCLPRGLRVEYWVMLWGVLSTDQPAQTRSNVSSVLYSIPSSTTKSLTTVCSPPQRSARRCCAACRVLEQIRIALSACCWKRRLQSGASSRPQTQQQEVEVVGYRADRSSACISMKADGGCVCTSDWTMDR